jgi:predicted dithiol-disulfide oxidoreductase (DUF899 family)
MENPQVVTREEWLVARKALLAREKAATRAKDELSAERRRLPMVEIENEYVFEGPSGRVGLRDLFEGRRQLILYHFMFDPEWDEGCNSCSVVADNVGHLAHLRARDTSFALVSRAPPVQDRAVQGPHGVVWGAESPSELSGDPPRPATISRRPCSSSCFTPASGSSST